MQAKFDEIMVPITRELIDEDQQEYVVFDAFFANTMFHEVAHGLGIKNTVTGVGTVREALREHASPMEEGKADVVGLHMVTQLFERGELTEYSINHHYVTFLVGIFRSIRFGATSAHGRANMVRFNYFLERGAFTRDEATGRYRVDFEAMQEAVSGLSELILTLQGDGDYEGVTKLIEEKGVVLPELQADLDRLDSAGISARHHLRAGSERTLRGIVRTKRRGPATNPRQRRNQATYRGIRLHSAPPAPSDDATSAPP